ncbi:hypothetical protein ACFWVU_15300 [Streptomyces sp. NPDC058686]|uniref:hypothetical protein n=1 Tax=Streptomyces sp. NPDC058686 TaxID=3346599 RepID=UPI003658D8AE
MAALLWLLIPLVAAVGAGLWGSWAARNRRTGDVSELNGYARFREAMERSHTGTEADPLDPPLEPPPGPEEGSVPAVESRTDAPAVH